MVGRVTQRLMVQRSLTSMQTALGRLANTQEQLTSGRIINRPSDSPTGTNTAMRLREQAANQTQYARNAQDGIGWLGRADSTLQSMNAQVRKVRELALQGASTGTSSPESRDALATEATQIRESLLALANTQHMGRPLFGGDTAGKVAYNEDGTYAGNDAAVTRTVGDGVQVRVNVTGREAFGTGADNVFTVLDDVIDNLTGNPGGLSDNLDQLDASMSRIQTTLSSVGTRYGRVENAIRLSDDMQLDLKASLSNVENVDIAKATMDLQMQEVAYQAALGATARVLQPSLLDFLR